MAKPKDPVYAEGANDVPHPSRFPGSDTPARYMSLAAGRVVDSDLNDSGETDLSEYGATSRNCSEF